MTKTPRQKGTSTKARASRADAQAHPKSRTVAAQKKKLAQQKNAKKPRAMQASSRKPRAAALPRAPRPRVRLGDAMRQKGLDEIAAARAMRKFIRAVSDDKPKDKLLLEALKEVFRVLEPVRTGDRAAADAPVHVQLIHYVARPCESQPPVDVQETPPALALPSAP